MPDTGRKFSITNLTKRPLVVSLNSKESLHLAPGARMSDIAERDLVNNPDVTKLESLNLIQRDPQEPVERERIGRKSKAATQTQE